MPICLTTTVASEPISFSGAKCKNEANIAVKSAENDENDI